MSNFERILDDIDSSLAAMRANLERGEMLLHGLGEWQRTSEETNYFSYETRADDGEETEWFDEIRNDYDDNQWESLPPVVRFSEPLEYDIDAEFDDDDDGDGSRRLSFSSDTSSSTVAYFTPFDYGQYSSLYSGYDSDSDSSTVVGEWEEPWRSPDGLLA